MDRRQNRPAQANRSNPRREARRAAAEKHTAEVAERLAKDIERSRAGVVRYDGAPKVEVTEPCVPEVAVVAQDAIAAVLENGRGYAQFCDLAVLDFASFVNPGGGYIRGGLAQEEALCTESYLYNVLDGERDWYQENRRRNINCELYRERALVVPAVRFERGKMHAYADVIVAAAPNARRAREEYRVADDALAAAMRDRICFVLDIADALGHEKVVLGAYGCGVFGWDAEQVAELFRAELAGGTHGVKQVVFAIPRTRYDENLPKFEHAFSAFPEAPAVTYAEERAAQEAERARDAAAAAAQDDDEDDDWRKYL
ncbi:TIGR02452 family protein [Enorma phocaeensis]|uniref:TIGR02452 family protein n=1 Tax=Enorma phocaeensis TaxID=1871019 RepID=UPI002357B38B|nr:TIGR02452 family protein [Enorma phocaeensis]